MKRVFRLIVITALLSGQLFGLGSGEHVANTISPAGDVDEYTFSGVVGEAVRIGCGDVSSSGFTPKINLLAPGGGLVVSDADSYGALIAVQLPATGTYTIQVSDNTDTWTGSYDLCLAKGSGSFPLNGDNGTISNGEETTGSLSYGDLDIWSFQAVTGEAIRVGLGEVTGNGFAPTVEVFDPQGRHIGGDADNYGAYVATAASSTGTYTVIVRDDGANVAGDYRLSLGLGVTDLAASNDGGTLPNGVDQTGAIEWGEYDVWEFDATSGDSIRLGLGEISGNGFYPHLELFSPAGQLLGSWYDADGLGANVQASTTGTYRVMVSDYGNDVAGNYHLSLVRITAPIEPFGDGGALVNGEDRSGSLPYGDLDVWTFDAEIGDGIRIGMGETSGNGFYPQIEVFGPNGQWVGGDYGSEGCNVGLAASQAGTYTVVASDYGNDHIGDYHLSFVQAPAALTPSGDSGVLTNAVDVSGSIPYGDYDVWTFEADTGDAIRLGIGETSGNGFYPQIEIFDPSGQWLGTAYGSEGSQFSLTASMTGTFTVAVSDYGNDHSGSYGLSFGRIPENFTPFGDSGVITPTEDRSGSISYGDYDFWSFEVVKGDPIRLAVGETSGNGFAPQIEIFDPSGNRIGNRSGSEGASYYGVAASSGVYVVAVSDSGNDHAGSYLLSLSLPPWEFTPSGDSGFLTAGSASNGSIGYGDLDSWAFQANTGDTISLLLDELSGNGFSPQLELYSNDGTRVGWNWGTDQASLSYVVPASGSYIVVVSDSGSDHSGSYSLTGTGFTGGTVVFPEPDTEAPVLSLTKLGNGNLEVSWEYAAGWHVESSSDLTNWSDVSDMQISGSMRTKMITPITREFFRLSGE